MSVELDQGFSAWSVDGWVIAVRPVRLPVGITSLTTRASPTRAIGYTSDCKEAANCGGLNLPEPVDTCSRLDEPGGVGWKDVSGGHSLTIISGKRRSVATSGRSIGSVAKELGLRDSVLRRWVEQRGAGREPTAASRRPTTQATPPSADQAAEIAHLQQENERLRMEKDILKKSIAIFSGTRT